MQDTIKDLKEQMQDISLVAYEASEERHTREKKNLVICFTCIIITLIIALIGTNLAWILYESSMETVTETTTTETIEYDVEQDNESGNNNFIGNDGDING
jgi:hypothetical protein